MFSFRGGSHRRPPHAIGGRHAPRLLLAEGVGVDLLDLV